MLYDTLWRENHSCYMYAPSFILMFRTPHQIFAYLPRIHQQESSTLHSFAMTIAPTASAQLGHEYLKWMGQNAMAGLPARNIVITLPRRCKRRYLYSCLENRDIIKHNTSNNRMPLHIFKNTKYYLFGVFLNTLVNHILKIFNLLCKMLCFVEKVTVAFLGC